MRVTLTSTCVLVLGLAACGGDAPTPGVVPPLSGTEAVYDLAGAVGLEERAAETGPGLLNVFRLGDRIVSGSEPHGEAAMARLAAMGVKTILSVDGKAPDREAAARHGMRYVHVPIQYSGITAPERLRIAKTFRELEGPFYVHCFHGQHRGPAAAALGRIVLDGVPRDRAAAEMRTWCGTSKKYPGLYETVGRAPLPSPEETAAYVWDFPAAHSFGGFRQAMVDVTRVYDHLKLMADRNWQIDPEHPDLHAGNEAAKLVGIFLATTVLDEVREKPEDFRRWLAESLDHARALQAALEPLATGASPPAAANEAFAEIKARCDECHRGYRNE